jgi:hypothetical protein
LRSHCPAREIGADSFAQAECVNKKAQKHVTQHKENLRGQNRVMQEFAHGEFKSGRGSKGGKVKGRRQGSRSRSRRPAHRGTKAARRTREIAGNTNVRRPRARPPSRRGKASRMSARVAGARAAAPWAVRMRHIPLCEAARLRRRGNGRRLPASARRRSAGRGSEPASITNARHCVHRQATRSEMIRKLKSGEYRLYSRLEPSRRAQRQRSTSGRSSNFTRRG